MRDYSKHTKCLYYCRETDPRGGGGGGGGIGRWGDGYFVCYIG